jgi:hypothetical protein
MAEAAAKNYMDDVISPCELDHLALQFGDASRPFGFRNENAAAP